MNETYVNSYCSTAYNENEERTKKSRWRFSDAFKNQKHTFALLCMVLLVNFSAFATGCPDAISIDHNALPTGQSLVCGSSNDLSTGTIVATGLSCSTSYYGGLESLYKFTPLSSGSFNIAYSGQTWSGIFVFQGCPTTAGSTRIGCITSSLSSKNVTVTLAAGTEYYIMFDTWPTPDSPCTGTFTMTGPPPPSDFPPTCATTFNPAEATSNVVRNPSLTASGFTNGPTNYDLYLGTTPNPPFFGNYTTLPIATGVLSANTTYYWKLVPKNNIGEAAFCSVQSFTTGTGFNYCTAVPTSIDNQGLSNFTLGSFSNPNSSSATYQDFTSLEGLSMGLGTTNEVSVTGTYAPGYGVRVFIDFNQDGVFDLVTENFDIGEVTSTSTGTITVPLDAMMGQTRLRLVGTDSSANDPCYSGSWGNVEDYTVTITEAPSCLGVTTLTTSNISSSAAGLFWVDPNQSPASSYIIEYGVAGFELGTGTQITEGVTNPFGLQDLQPNTLYTFYVKSICGEGNEGAWSAGASFQTLCENFDLPFSENFNSTPTGFNTSPDFVPECWRFADSGAGSVYNYQFGTPFSAPAHFLMSNSSDNEGNYMLISPPVNNLGGALVSFYAYGAGSGYTLQVGTMTVNNDPSTFTLVETVALTGATNSHSLYTVTLPATTDGYLAFRHGLGGTFRTIYLDDITVQVPPVDPPSCVPSSTPLNASTDVALNPTISWTGASGFPDSYDIYFGTDAEPAFVNNVSSTQFTFTPGLLSANTTYYYKIVPKSENGEAVGCDVQSFITGNSFNYCTAVPTSMDANGITNVQLAGFSNPNVFSGTANAYQNFTALAGPQLELGTSNEIIVTLQTGFTYNVNVFIDFNQNGVFDLATEGFPIGLTSNANPVSITGSILVPVDAVLGQTRMRVVGTDGDTTYDPCYSSSWANVEDYTVNIMPVATCPAPTGIATTNIGPNSANIGWVTSSEVSSYQIEWGVTGFTQGTGTIENGVTTSPFTVSDLTPVTTYQYYIRSVCEGDNFGNWVGPISFSTTVVCPRPTAVSATAAFYTTAEVSWTNGGTETEWIIEYGVDGFVPGTGTEVTVFENPYTLNELTANTNYDIYVTAVCSEEDSSLQSQPASVYTGACIPVYTSGKTAGDLISNVSIAGTTLSNNSGTAPVNPAYTFFTATESTPNLTAELAQGSTYNVTVSIGTWGNQHVRAWIDFNEDGVFSDNESIGSAVIAQGQGSNAGGYAPASFEVSLTSESSLGVKTMRIRSAWDSNNSSTLFQTLDPCTSYGFGETEDYSITVVPAPPGTTIAAEDCGTTINSAFNEYFNIISVENAQAYRVKIVNGTNQQVYEVTNGTQVRFQDFGTFNFTYGTTYAVSVSTKLDEAFGPYGAACDITLTADPITAMESLCGTTIPEIGSKIYFQHVPQATNYRYSVTNTVTNEETFVVVNRRFMYLTDMEEFEFGTTYSIKCQVEIGGQYGSFGPACNLTTTGGVSSKLRTQFCNVVLTSRFQNVYADIVVGAVGYRFRVTNGADQTVVERTDSRFNLDMIPSTSVFDNTVYNVEVAVQYNGVWGNYGDVCTITTPPFVIPTTRLRTQFCNITVTSAAQNVYANVVRDATQYRFRVVNVASNLDVEVVRPDSRFTLAFAGGIEPSTAYQVTVAAYVGGEWGAYGSVCTLTTPALTPIQLRPQFCGTNLASLSSNFYAQFKSGAVEYRFRTQVGSELVEIYRPDSRCFLSAFGDVQTDVTYTIQASYKIGNAWSPWGAACTLTVFSPIPVITLDEASCGGTFQPFDIISSEIVPGATSYRFRAVADGNEYIAVTTSNEVDAFTFEPFMDIGTYEISVAAMVNNVWGAYGEACFVTFDYFEEDFRTIGSTDVTSTVAYPNPFDAGFELKFRTKSQSAINVVIYDMTGKLIEKQVITNLDVVNSFGANLAAGVYNVQVSQDDITHVVRVVKK